jgi:hypothetical protein
MGSIYRGSGLLERPFARHINGNAVYAVGDPDFQDFVASVWQPELQHLAARDPRYAYDMVLETLFGDARSDETDDPNWRLLQSTAHRFRYTDIIRDYAGPVEGTSSDPDLVRHVLRESPTTYLVHGQVFASAVHRLRSSTGLPIAATSLELHTPRERVVSETQGGRPAEGDTMAQSEDSEGKESLDHQQTPEPDLRADLERRVEALELAVAALDSDTSPYRRSHRPANHGTAAERKRRYWQALRGIHAVVSGLIPRDATVLMATKGDDLLLNLDGRRAWHFPRADNGAYAGHHPVDSAAAIGELEALRAKGADYLIVPDTAFWWFSYYHEFTQHLDSRYTRLETPDCCAVYRLFTG